MIEIAYDYSRCQPSQDCPRKELCARYTSKWNPFGQSVTDFSKEEICINYIDNLKEKQNE